VPAAAVIPIYTKPPSMFYFSNKINKRKVIFSKQKKIKKKQPDPIGLDTLVSNTRYYKKIYKPKKFGGLF